MAKSRLVDYTLVASSLLLYGLLGYVLERHQTWSVLGAYSAVFALYLTVALRKDIPHLNFWIYASILFRLLLVFNVPNLSDDFYRYIWDGRLLVAGHHPFAEVPSYYIHGGQAIPGITQELFSKLNSPDYFTVYPPVAQFIFWLAAKLSPTSVYGSMLVMKVILFGAEAGSILLLRSLLSHLNLPVERVLLYALNPLVILELMGNLHLEAVSIFFLMLGLYFTIQNRYVMAGLAMASSICAKLLPLIFLPALVMRLRRRQALVLIATIGLATLLLFIPLWNKEIVLGFRDSLGYYFQKFEFNASLFYIVRALGFWFYGYDIVQTVGWKLGLISALAITWISMAGAFRRQPGDVISVALMGRLLGALLVYCLFTTTLHPWYITTLMMISVLTPFRFAMIWTFTIFLTYSGYSAEGFKESMGIIAFEYITVIGYLVYELTWTSKRYSLLYS